MTHLTLFDHAAPTAIVAASPARPDDDTALLLATFQESRAAEGAHPRSVRREVGQLRALVREAESAGRFVTPQMLVEDVDLLARLLREPATMISRSTGRARLLAVQRFISIVGPLLGRDP